MKARLTIADFLDEQLAEADSGFSIGVPGAIAEFMRAGGEARVRRDGSAYTVSTRGGAMRIVLVDGVTAVCHASKRQVALCLPEDAAAMGARRVLTELGPDGDAIDRAARGSVRFDLGLGIAHVDACVRSRDPALLDCLRRASGRNLLAEAREAREAIVEASPERVFCSRLGRIEVSAPIPKDRSPRGPHTHLLPHLLGDPPPMAAQLPPGYLDCLDIYPARRVDTFHAAAID